MTNSIKITCTLGLIVLLSVMSINNTFAQFQFMCDYNGTAAPGLSLTAITDATPGDPSGTAQAGHTQIYTLTDASNTAFFLKDRPGAEVSAMFAGLQNGVVYTFCSFNVPDAEVDDFDGLLIDAAAVTDASDGTFINTNANPDMEFCYTQVCTEYSLTCCGDEIEGVVVADEAACNLAGIEVTITDADGNPVLTDPSDPTSAPLVLTTDAFGIYGPTAGIYECGNYFAALTDNVPACYDDGEIGPVAFVIDGDPNGIDTDGANFGGATNIPTVGEWGLIILALLMSIVAVAGIRERKASELSTQIN